METCVKIGFAKISLAAKKFWVSQNLGREEGGGGVAAPSSPGPYAHGCHHLFLQSNT